MELGSDGFGGIRRFLEAAGRLKDLKRAGWVRVGIPSPESVADHSFRVAVMALLFGPRLGLNVDKMVRLALIHDLAESRVGDLTPTDRVTSVEKRELESLAFAEIVDGLPEGSALVDLWREYAEEATAEARAVHQLDKLELALQALVYELQYGRKLEKMRSPSIPPAPGRSSRRRATQNWADQFWASARTALTDPLLVQFYDDLQALRPEP